jgi:4-amino-4-deoxy-L-arabinose transferase-like glycosyltransferase
MNSPLTLFVSRLQSTVLVAIFAFTFLLVLAVFLAMAYWRTPFSPMVAFGAGFGAWLAVTLLGRYWHPSSIQPTPSTIQVSFWKDSGFWLAVAGGFLLRFAWIIIFPVEQYSDYATYWSLAMRIANGQDYVVEYQGFSLYAFRPVGLPLLLAGFIRVFGPEGWIPTLLNLLVYVVTQVFIFLITSLVAGRRAALVGVALFAILPSTFVVTGLANTETISMLVLVIALYLGLILNQRRPFAIFLFGMVIGFGILVRPTAYVLLPIFALYAFLLIDFSKAAGKGRWVPVSNFVLLFLGAWLVMGPWAVRNLYVAGQFTPMTTMGGMSLFIGNNEIFDGRQRHRPEDERIRPMIQEILDQAESERDISAIAEQRAVEWIVENPVEFVRNGVYKFIRFSTSAADQFHWILKGKYGYEETGPLLSAVSAYAEWLWFLCWCGIALAAIRFWRSFLTVPWLSLLAMCFGYLFIVHTVFYGFGRYNAPMNGVMMMFAALGLAVGLNPSVIGRQSPDAIR